MQGRSSASASSVDFANSTGAVTVFSSTASVKTGFVSSVVSETFLLDVESLLVTAGYSSARLSVLQQHKYKIILH